MKNHTFRATGTMIVLALTAIQSLAQSIYEPYTFITLAGNTGYGVALDSAGILYVADANNKTIQKLMPDGVVTILAGLPGVSGSADGAGSDARFGSSYNGPTGVAVDTAGNVYVADSGNSTIRKMTPVGTNWVVTTLAGLPQVDANDWPVGGSADGMGSAARFHYPYGVAVDSAGSLYVADTFNATIRKVSPEGVVTTLAGLAGRLGSADGTGSAARFYNPCAVAVDTAGNVYVAEWGNNTIRKMTLVGTNWMVTTLAGLPQVDAAGFHVGGSADGTGSAARFGYPSGVAVDSAGTLYVADTSNGMIRKVTPAGVVTTLAGVAQFDPNGNPLGGIADGTGSAARFNQPSGVAVDSAGNLSVADSSTIRKGFPAVGRPVIFTQPKGRTVTATYGVTFSALANGTVPLAYQWFKDGVELPGATNTSLSIATVQAADAGVYTFTVSNVLGRVSSSNAVLAVMAARTEPGAPRGLTLLPAWRWTARATSMWRTHTTRPSAN